MLEAFGEAANGAREMTIGGVGGSARRRGVMRFVEDEHGAGTEVLEQLNQAIRISLVSEQAVWEMMKREPAVHGLVENPRFLLTAAT